MSDHRPASGTADDGLRRASGRDRVEWYALLDDWGAQRREYRRIAAWLTHEHGLSDWWAQKLIVEYEQERGTRAPGARRDGTYAGGASKTVSVPVERLFAAFVDPGLRRRWLPGLRLHERTARPGRSARFDLDDGTRLSADFTALGEGKSQVGVEQTRLPESAAAAAAKALWRERLAALKELLER